MTAPTAKTIYVEVSAGAGQTNSYTETLKIGDRKLRIRIHSDSYDFQSWARIETFDPVASKWNQLADIHYSNMRTRVAYRDARAADFKIDRDNLLAQAIAILE